MTTQPKFTKGPWIVRQIGGPGFPGQVGYAIDYNEDQEQVVDFVYEEADAHVMAAAPELYEALDAADTQMQMAYECVEAGRYDEALLHLGAMSRGRRAALSKARGEVK